MFKIKANLEEIFKIAQSHVNSKREMEGIELIGDYKLIAKFDLTKLVVILADLG
jgi:hypothetical protein